MTPRHLRILMLGPKCYPPQGPEGLVNSNLSLALINAGYDVQIISANIGILYPLLEEDMELWAPLKERAHIAPLYAGRTFRHLYHHIRGTILTSYPLTGVNWANPACAIAKRLHRTKPFDVILSRSFPAGVAAQYLSKQFDIPYIQNWNDPFPNQRYPVPYGSGPSAQISFWMKRFLGQNASKSTFLTFPCERLRDYMISYLPEDMLEKSKIIPHIALAKSCVKSQAKTNDVFVLCHAGWLPAERNPRVFFEGLRLFLNRSKADKEVIVRIIGAQTPEVDDTVAACNLKEIVRVYPPRNYLGSLSEVASADVAVLIEAPCEEGIFLPSKFVDYIRLGVPIMAVSPREGTINDVLKKFGGGMIADNRSVRSVAETLQVLWTHWKGGNLKEEFRSDRALPQYSETRVLSLYENLFESIL